MTRFQKFSLVLLRVAVGWLFLYQGITAILNPAWSLVPLIKGAHTFPDLYRAAASPAVAPFLGFVVKGLMVLVGALLISGLYVRIVSIIGIALMLFLYFPLLSFPNVGAAYYVVDEHVLVAVVLLFLFFIRAGEYYSLGSVFARSFHRSEY